MTQSDSIDVLQSKVKTEQDTCVSYNDLICVNRDHSFSLLQWAPGWVCDREIAARWTVIVCVHFYMCVCEKERHRCEQTHTLSKSHRSSQGAQTIGGPSLFNHIFASNFSLIFPLPPWCKGKETRSCHSSPSTLSWHPSTQCCWGARAEGLDEQTMGTALPAAGIRELLWA